MAQVALMGLFVGRTLLVFSPCPGCSPVLSAAGENVSSVDALGSSSALALSIWSGTAFVVLASCIYFRRDIIIWGVVALPRSFLIASGHISLLLMGLCSLFFPRVLVGSSRTRRFLRNSAGSVWPCKWESRCSLTRSRSSNN